MGIFRRREPIEDTPLAGQGHLTPPAPEMEAMEVSESGHLRAPDDDVDRPTAEELTLADLIPPQPVTRAQLQAMEAEETAKKRERALHDRLVASADPLDQIEILFQSRIWGEMDYDDPLSADEAVSDLLAGLRATDLLGRVWDEGFTDGVAAARAAVADWVSNPYRRPPERPADEIRTTTIGAFGRTVPVRIYRGL